MAKELPIQAEFGEIKTSVGKELPSPTVTDEAKTMS